MASVEPGWKPPERGTPKVKLPDSSDTDWYFRFNFSSSFSSVGFFILLLWLVCGIVALFFGWAGGQWGWGFGFAWYLPLLAAVATGMAGLGIYASIKIWSRR